MTSETAFAGWVRKSHLGRPLEPSSGGLERWLVLDGFHVAYFKDNSLAKRHGRFDLRNVMSAGPSADPNAADAVDLVISTDGAGAVYKTLTLSFDGADGPQWKHLLASAVDGRRVSGDLATFRSEALARRFDALHHAQPCLRSSAWANQGGHLLTPREAPSDDGAPPMGALPGVPHLAGGGGLGALPESNDVLDTPRGGPSDEPALFEVSVPAGAVAGDVLHSTLPSGATVRFTVPPGAQPGHVLAFEVPREFGGPPPEVRAAVAAVVAAAIADAAERKAPGAGARLRAAAWSGGGSVAAPSAAPPAGLSERRSGDVSVGEVRRALMSGGFDTSGVEVDDEEQAPPTVEAGSAEEGRLLAEMESQLPPELAARAPKAAKLACLRGRKYDPARGAALLPEFVALREELRLDEAAGDDGAAERAAQLARDAATGKVVCAGGKDAQGRAIIWVRLRLHNPRECSAEDMARLVVTVMCKALEDVETQRRGIVMFSDGSEVGLRNMDPRVPKYLMGSVLPRLPVRVARIVMYNPPFIVGRVIFPIVRALMSRKVAARIALLPSADHDALHAILPPAAISADYGGSRPFHLSGWLGELGLGTRSRFAS